MHTKTPTRRSGFTLVELLVVIAIMAILVSLTLAAVVRLRASQEKSTTETMVSKIDSALQRQFKAVIDQAKEEFAAGAGGIQFVTPPPVPPAIGGYPALLTIAGGDVIRARALYVKLRIKQEFPQTILEATTNPTLGPVYIGGGQAYTFILPAKTTYFSALNSMASQGAFVDSAACLRMAMSVERRGEKALADEALGGKGSVQVAYAKPLPAYSDAWGYPIGFCRWPSGNAEMGGISNIDPQDPESKLYDPVWWNFLTTNNNPPANLTTIELQLHPFRPLTGLANKNVTPVVISPGLNHNSEANLPYLVDPANGSDDIYSFRLRKSGSRGD